MGISRFIRKTPGGGLALPALIALIGLLAAFVAPAASAASTYDITQVGNASWVSVTDSNGKELSGLTTGATNVPVTATIRVDIDDMTALKEGDAVTVGMSCTESSHFWPNLFTDTNLPSYFVDRSGRQVFNVRLRDQRTLLLVRTGEQAQGGFSIAFDVRSTLWGDNTTTTSEWRIGKSSVYTFANRPTKSIPCNKSNGIYPGTGVSDSVINLSVWVDNCTTITTVAKNGDTSAINAGDVITWFHAIPETGQITGGKPWAAGYWVKRAYDENTPGDTYDTRDNTNYLTRDTDADVSTFDAARTSLKPGFFAIRTLSDGSLAVACNYGSHLPGLANSLQVKDKGNATTLKLLAKIGHIWQNAQFGVYVRFADETVPNRVKVEMQSTESAYQTTTLTTKPLDPAIGQGQSAIRYDPNGGDGDAFRKVGDPGTAATTPEAATFTRTGHTFTGWNTKADGSGTSYQAGAAIAYPAEGQVLTLYAQWKTDTYRVEFKDWQGRTITSGTADYGTTPTAPALADTTWLADPDMNFDNVDGWHKSDAWSGSFEFTKDGLVSRTRDLYGPIKKPFDGMVHIEFQGDASKAKGAAGAGYNLLYDPSSTNYAEWRICPLGQASCRYDGYSDNAGMTEYDIQSWLQIDSYDDKGYGELLARRMQLTQVDPTMHNGVARDGYVFTGWDRDVTKPITGDTVYTARYRPAVYKVRFDANGGMGTMSDQKHTYGQRQALTANAFTREGYRFTGWNTRADGRGKAFADGQAVTNLLAHEDAVGVLYAQWERVPETMLPMAGGTAGCVPSAAGMAMAAALALGVIARRRAKRHAA